MLDYWMSKTDKSS